MAKYRIHSSSAVTRPFDATGLIHELKARDLVAQRCTAADVTSEFLFDVQQAQSNEIWFEEVG